MSFADYTACRIVGHIVRIETIHTNEDPKRTVDTGLWTGHALFGNGEVAVVSGVDTSDSRDGSFTFVGYGSFVFPDGATFSQSYGGKGSAKLETNQATSEGTWEFTGGTGRMSGIAGSGTTKTQYAGERWIHENAGPTTKG